MLWRRKKIPDSEIAPDEIFLDASNAPAFDRARFEGRLEKPLAYGTFVTITVALALLFIILAGRAWYLQITHGSEFASDSAHNSLESVTIFATRGTIVDMNGVILAENVQKEDGTISRNYPIPALGQIIGYVSLPKKDSKGIYYDTKMTGLAGLEAEYDSLLAGENGQVLTEKDALGNVRSEGVVVPEKDGSILRLSLDANLEKLLATAIRDTVVDKNFIAGAGVIMDVHTGSVRALVSVPSYDPNVMTNGGPADLIKSYSRNIGRPFLNHAVQGVYVPGSIVKPFIAAGALTDGIITPQTIIDDPGFIEVQDPYRPGKKFVYKSWKELGLMDVRRAIAWSSDVFFYTIGGGFGNQKGLGIDRLGYWFKQFGLGSQTGIDLQGEAVGVVPSPEWKKKIFDEPWYTGDTYFTAIGQYGMQVSPVQMVRATAAVANGGTLPVPTLSADATPVSTVVPISVAALRVVREGMRQTVTDATATTLNFSYVKVAAKTGTAQTGTRNQYDNSWVVGFFPYDNPQYAFAIVLERGPEGSGSQAVNVMQTLFNSLYSQNSVYVGGSATTTAY